MLKARQASPYKPKDFNYGSKTPSIRVRRDSIRSPLRVPDSQKDWRESNDYRKDYLRDNRGIGGYLYVCSQCFRPMVRKKTIKVDHIIPPSRFAVKKWVPADGDSFGPVEAILYKIGLKKKLPGRGKWVKTSPMARMLNSSFNCAAICQDCNSRKSNKLNLQIVRGYVMKAFELTASAMNFVLSLPFLAIFSILFVIQKTVSASIQMSGGGKRNKRRRRG